MCINTLFYFLDQTPPSRYHPFNHVKILSSITPLIPYITCTVMHTIERHPHIPFSSTPISPSTSKVIIPSLPLSLTLHTKFATYFLDHNFPSAPIPTTIQQFYHITCYLLLFEKHNHFLVNFHLPSLSKQLIIPFQPLPPPLPHTYKTLHIKILHVLKNFIFWSKFPPALIPTTIQQFQHISFLPLFEKHNLNSSSLPVWTSLIPSLHLPLNIPLPHCEPTHPYCMYILSYIFPTTGKSLIYY